MSLRRWHQEKWVDVKTGKPCGRKSAKGSSRGYPACRPSKRVSSKTPKTQSEMSPSEKAKFKRTKTSSNQLLSLSLPARERLVRNLFVRECLV
jgi:hypothetical protein